MNLTMETFVSYMGAKTGSGVYQAIINLMPPHETYIEAFLGSGAIMQRKPMARRSIGIELDKPVLDEFWCSYPVERVNADSINWLKKFKPTDKTLIYCDPPYVHSTRTSKHRYRCELSNDDHEELLQVLKDLTCKGCYVILSGYRSELYDRILANWWSCDFQAMTRGGVRTETLWCNWTPGETIHYHTFAGKNFTDRQRIKRKAERWADNFSKLPAVERQAVLAAILSGDNVLQ